MADPTSQLFGSWSSFLLPTITAAAAICAEADAVYARAAKAAERAAEESRAVLTLEDRSLETVFATARDARRARETRVPDFYNHATGAWSAIHAVRVVAEETSRQAVLVDNAVTKALDSNQGYGLQNLNRQVKEAVAKAEDARYSAKEAEDRVNEFAEANRTANKFRDGEQKAAESAAKEAEAVVKACREASTAARNAAKHAAQVLQHVTKVKAVAAQGMIEEARREAKKAAEIADLGEKELQNAQAARDKARELVLNLVKH